VVGCSQVPGCRALVCRPFGARVDVASKADAAAQPQPIHDFFIFGRSVISILVTKLIADKFCLTLRLITLITLLRGWGVILLEAKCHFRFIGIKLEFILISIIPFTSEVLLS
jgi:hypothetical protein